MNYLKLALIWLCLVLGPQFVTLRVAVWAFTSESAATYQRVDRLIESFDERQSNRMATIGQMERRLNDRDGLLLEEAQRRIDVALARHERSRHIQP